MAISLEQLRSRLHDLESKISAPHTSYALVASTSLSSNLSDGCPSLSASSSVSSNGFSETEWVEGLSQSASFGSEFNLSDISPLKELPDYLRTNERGDTATPKPKYDTRGGYFPPVGKLANESFELRGSTSGPWDWNKRSGRGHQRLSYRVGELLHSEKAGPIARDFTYRTDITLTELASNTILVLNRQRQKCDIVLSDPGFCSPHKNGSTTGERILQSKMKPCINLGLGVPESWIGEVTPKAGAESVDVLLSTSSRALDVPPDNVEKQAASKSPKILGSIKLIPIDKILAFMNTPSPMDALPSPILSEKLLWPSGMDLADSSQKRQVDEQLQATPINRSARTGLGISVEGLPYPTTVRS